MRPKPLLPPVADFIEVTGGFLSKPEGQDYQLVGPELDDPKYFGIGVGIGLRKGETALKEALILTAFEEFSQLEAAQMLGVSVKTIETRVYRARKILVDQLDPDMRPSAT